MELTNFSFYYGNSVDAEVVGAIAYRNSDLSFYGSMFHDFELNLVVVFEGASDEPPVQHCHMGGERCQVLNVKVDDLERKLLSGNHQVLMKCVVDGKIIQDDHGRLTDIKNSLMQTGSKIRERKLFMGFARFLEKYVESKKHMKESREMDAYYSILGALHHWAELELIEQGIHSNAAIWEQTKGLNLSVRKLYEELTVSTETLRQRVELVLLACEFAVMSKMQDCSLLLLRILRSRRQPWTLQELLLHPELRPVSSALPLVLRKLAFRSIIKEDPYKKAANGCEAIRYYAN